MKSLFDNNGKEYKFVDIVYPVGSIYMSVNNVSPQTFIGGVWVRLENRFLLGASSSYGVNSTGGETTHKLTESEMPKISGSVGFVSTGNTQGIINETSGVFTKREISVSGFQPNNQVTMNSTARSFEINFGNNQPHNNMPPYLAVYMWKRTS